jgi:hypothetical protein
VFNIGNPSTVPDLVNYRLYGDQISLIGTQLGNTVTVENPLGADPQADGTQPDIDNRLVEFLTFHEMTRLRSQLEAGNAQETPGAIGHALGPNYVLPILYMFVLDPLSPNWLIAFHALVGQALGVILFDPPPGLSYELVASPDSPDFYSLQLPRFLEGVEQWKVSYLINGLWSDEEILTGIYDFIFSEGVNGLRFIPLGADGLPTFNASYFNFGLSFYTEGTFDATMVAMVPISSTVPEPSTLWLLVSAVLGVILILHRRPPRSFMDGDRNRQNATRLSASRRMG